MHTFHFARLTTRAALVALVAGGSACHPKQVNRIDPAAVTDLSGRWNDTDSRLVANELIRQSLDGAWLKRFSDAHGGASPTILVGNFDNRTFEHIAVGTFVNDLERAFTNSGTVQVVAGGAGRDAIRDERTDQQKNANAGTRSKLANETGARYMLQGEIQATPATLEFQRFLQTWAEAHGLARQETPALAEFGTV